MRVLFLAMTAAALAFACAAETLQGWSSNGKATFQDVQFNFRQGVAKVGERAFKLSDCSSPEFYCARSDIGDLLLPRSCPLAINVGDRWISNGVEMRVVAEVDEPKGHLYVDSGPLYILQPARNQHFAILYKKIQGPLAIFYDAERALDFSWARPNGAGNFTPVFREASIRASYRTTEDNFAPCH